MSSNKLTQAVDLIKAGNKSAALPILKEILHSDPNNETAWLWLYTCVDTISQKTYCLQQALRINPNNKNAQQALENLSKQTPLTPESVRQLPVQNITARPPSNSKEIKRSTPQKSNANRTLLIGSIAIVFLVCIGGSILGGAWFLNMNPLNVAQVGSDNSDGSSEPNNTNISDPTPVENSIPDAVSSPTVSQNSPSPNVRFVPTLFRREQATDFFNNPEAGWDVVNIEVAVENHSDNIVFYSSGGVKVMVSEGFEYGCVLYGNTAEAAKDFILPRARVLYEIRDCKIPSTTSGLTVKVIYDLVSRINNDGSPYICRNSPDSCQEWKDLTAEFNPEQTVQNMTFPFLESVTNNIDTYAQEHNMRLESIEQPFDLFDLTLNLVKTDKDGNVFIATEAKSNFLGGNTEALLIGIYYHPDGSVENWQHDYGQSPLMLGPGQSIVNEDACYAGDGCKYIPNSYIFIYDNEVVTTDKKVLPSFILIYVK